MFQGRFEAVDIACQSQGEEGEKCPVGNACCHVGAVVAKKSVNATWNNVKSLRPIFALPKTGTS